MKHNSLTAEINRKRLSDPIQRKITNERNNKSRQYKMKDIKYRTRINTIAHKRLKNPIKYKQKLKTNNDYYDNLKKKNPKQYNKRLKRTRIQGIKDRKKDRIYTIANYGGKCKCCGESGIQFLSIDHINGGGTKHRKEIKISIYRWLRMKNYPTTGYRILCYNCNMALAFYGYCHDDFI